MEINGFDLCCYQFSLISSIGAKFWVYKLSLYCHQSRSGNCYAIDKPFPQLSLLNIILKMATTKIILTIIIKTILFSILDGLNGVSQPGGSSYSEIILFCQKLCYHNYVCFVCCHRKTYDGWIQFLFGITTLNGLGNHFLLVHFFMMVSMVRYPTLTSVTLQSVLAASYVVGMSEITIVLCKAKGLYFLY